MGPVVMMPLKITCLVLYWLCVFALFRSLFFLCFLHGKTVHSQYFKSYPLSPPPSPPHRRPIGYVRAGRSLGLEKNTYIIRINVLERNREGKK